MAIPAHIGHYDPHLHSEKFVVCVTFGVFPTIIIFLIRSKQALSDGIEAREISDFHGYTRVRYRPKPVIELIKFITILVIQTVFL